MTHTLINLILWWHIPSYCGDIYIYPLINGTITNINDPFISRPDRTMQDIVYKLVPGLYQSELLIYTRSYGDMFHRVTWSIK